MTPLLETIDDEGNRSVVTKERDSRRWTMVEMGEQSARCDQFTAHETSEGEADRGRQRQAESTANAQASRGEASEQDGLIDCSRSAGRGKREREQRRSGPVTSTRASRNTSQTDRKARSLHSPFFSLPLYDTRTRTCTHTSWLGFLARARFPPTCVLCLEARSGRFFFFSSLTAALPSLTRRGTYSCDRRCILRQCFDCLAGWLWAGWPRPSTAYPQDPA